MRILPSVARRTRTLLRRILTACTRPRPLLLFCFALTLFHYGSYRWLHTRYRFTQGILQAIGTDAVSETAGSSASDPADSAVATSGSTAPFGSFLSSFWSSPPVLQHRTSAQNIKANVLPFQGGFVTTPADSLVEEERQRDARRFWIGLRGALWYLRAEELVATGIWGLGAFGLWSSSYRLLRILHAHTSLTLYSSICFSFILLLLLTIDAVREDFCATFLASEAFQSELDSWSRTRMLTDAYSRNARGRMTSQGEHRETWHETTARTAIAVWENVLSDGDTCSYALLSAGRTIVSASAMILIAILLALETLLASHIASLPSPVGQKQPHTLDVDSTAISWMTVRSSLANAHGNEPFDTSGEVIKEEVVLLL